MKLLPLEVLRKFYGLPINATSLKTPLHVAQYCSLLKKGEKLGQITFVSKELSERIRLID